MFERDDNGFRDNVFEMDGNGLENNGFTFFRVVDIGFVLGRFGRIYGLFGF